MLLAEMDRRYRERFEAQTKALDAAFLAAQTAVQSALLSAEKAVTKAETAAERRFESVNEFRATLADQAAQLMSRAEAQAPQVAVDAKLAALGEKVDANTLRVEKMASTSGGLKAGWGYLVAGVGVVYVLCFDEPTVVPSSDGWHAPPTRHYAGWTGRRPPDRRVRQHGVPLSSVVEMIYGSTRLERTTKETGTCARCGQRLAVDFLAGIPAGRL